MTIGQHHNPKDKNKWGNLRLGNYTEIDDTGDINQYGDAVANLNATTITGNTNITGDVDITGDLGVTGEISSGTGKFGDVAGGDYSEFEADGTLKFNGDSSVYADQLSSLVTQPIPAAAAADIVPTASTGLLVFKTTCVYPDDYVSITFQFNHDRKAGANVYPHLHWVQYSSAMPNWLIQYAWSIPGGTYNAVASGTLAKYSSNVFTYSAGAIHQKTLFPAITPPAGDTPSTIIIIRLYRDVTNVSTLFASTEAAAGTPVDVGAFAFDIHKEVDTVGSRTQTAK